MPGPDSPRGTPRLPIVDALRGVAAIAVAVYHFCDPLRTGIPTFLHNYGWAGVDVFFVISGVVVPLSLHGRGYGLRDFPRFMARRMVRLEPPYLASIAVVIVTWHAVAATPWYHGPPPDYSATQIAAHFLYLIPLTKYAWLNQVYWTLAYEFVFYVTIGLTFAFLSKRRIEWTVMAAAAIFGLSFLLRSVPDVRILEFAVGVLLMRLLVAEGRAWTILAWLAIGLGTIVWFGGPIIGGGAAIAAASIALIRDRHLGRWATWAAGISYSLYLTHSAIGSKVVNIGLRFGSGPAYEVLLIGAALAVSLLFAVAFAALVEWPAIRASKRIRLAPPTAAVSRGANPPRAAFPGRDGVEI